MPKLRPARKHQSVLHKARTLLLCHSPYLCFLYMYTYTSYTQTFTHTCTARFGSQEEISLSGTIHQPALIYDVIVANRDIGGTMYLRFVHHVCLSDLTEPLKWATMPCSVHNISLLKHNLEFHIGMISCCLDILASRHFGNTISHFKGSLKYSSAWNRS